MAANPREAVLEWEFHTGARLKFAHLEYEKNVHDWHGSQIPLIGFDELTHFTEKQFVYMFSRNRSTSGVKSRIRATCNPDADSWVKKWIEWYLDEAGEYPDPAKSGKLRWFIRKDDSLVWADSKEELEQKFAYDVPKVMPKSFTFIPSKLSDNKILLQKDPGYLANLMALSRVERERLLGGNWSIRAQAGTIFQAQWFRVVDAIPSEWIQMVRYWDRAATKPHTGNPDPDWTRGLKLYRYRDGSYVVADLKSIRDTPGQVEQFIKNTASHDGQLCPIVGEQDPGSAGKADAENFIKMLNGYDVRVVSNSKDKVTRAKPVSAQCEGGNIRVLRAGWNDEFFRELENFPDGAHDDIVDVLSGAFNQMSGGLSILDVL